MTLKQRLLSLILIDSAIVLFSIYICSLILTAGNSPVTEVIVTSSIVLLLVHHVCAYRFRLYKRAWEYASITELKAIVYAVTISVAAAGLTQLIFFFKIFTHER